MRVLLDTNVLLWATGVSSRLSRATRDLLEDTGTTVLFSAASLWEIGIKARLGRSDLEVVPREVANAAFRSGFIERPITSDVALVAATLPFHHKDLFDRMLVAQAIAEPATLLTTDRLLIRYSELVSVVDRQPS